VRYGDIGGVGKVCVWGEECDASWHRESGLRDDVREDNSWTKVRHKYEKDLIDHYTSEFPPVLSPVIVIFSAAKPFKIRWCYAENISCNVAGKRFSATVASRREGAAIMGALDPSAVDFFSSARSMRRAREECHKPPFCWMS
jgi:hypothetical protein